MNRRRLLKAGGGVLGLGGLGTVGYIELNNAEVQSTGDISLSPGGSGVFTIHWSSVTGMSVRSVNDQGLMDSELIKVELSDDILSPPPDSKFLSYPPGWIWDSPTEVEMQLPIEVAPDAPPGEYPLTISASGPGDTLVRVLGTKIYKLIGSDTRVTTPPWTFSITVSE